MHDEEIRREIRGTSCEAALLAVEEAGGVGPHSLVVSACAGDELDASESAATLRRLGLASTEQSMASETTLTGRGRQMARSILRSRMHGEERWDRVERAIVDALVHNDGNGWRVDEVDGRPVSEEEFRLAVRKLENWDLVRVLRAGAGQIYSVMPRDLIHQVPGIEGLLQDFFEGRIALNDNRSTTNIGHGNTIGGVQTGGRGNAQSVAQVVPVEARVRIIALASGLGAGIGQDEGDASPLRAAIQEIGALAEGVDTSREEIRARIVSAIVVAGESDSGLVVLQGLAQMLGMTEG